MPHIDPRVHTPPQHCSTPITISFDTAIHLHHNRTVEAVKPAAITVAANILVAMPALANEEPGKLFDFGLTLPFMAAQFLLLMVFLDKAWFGPVGRHLDERDSAIRDKLASFREGTTEVADLLEKAEAAVREARAEAQQTILKAKAEAQAESAKKLDAVKQVRWLCAQDDPHNHTCITESGC